MFCCDAVFFSPKLIFLEEAIAFQLFRYFYRCTIKRGKKTVSRAPVSSSILRGNRILMEKIFQRLKRTAASAEVLQPNLNQNSMLMQSQSNPKEHMFPYLEETCMTDPLQSIVWYGCIVARKKWLGLGFELYFQIHGHATIVHVSSSFPLMSPSANV